MLEALRSPLREAAAFPGAVPKRVVARIEAIVAPSLQPSRTSGRIASQQQQQQQQQQVPSGPVQHVNMQQAAIQLAAAGRPAPNGSSACAGLAFAPGAMPAPLIMQQAWQWQQQQLLAQQQFALVCAESQRGMRHAMLAPQQRPGAGAAPAPGQAPM